MKDKPARLKKHQGRSSSEVKELLEMYQSLELDAHNKALSELTALSHKHGFTTQLDAVTTLSHCYGIQKTLLWASGEEIKWERLKPPFLMSKLKPKSKKEFLQKKLESIKQRKQKLENSNREKQELIQLATKQFKQNSEFIKQINQEQAEVKKQLSQLTKPEKDKPQALPKIKLIYKFDWEKISKKKHHSFHSAQKTWDLYHQKLNMPIPKLYEIEEELVIINQETGEEIQVGTILENI